MLQGSFTYIYIYIFGLTLLDHLKNIYQKLLPFRLSSAMVTGREKIGLVVHRLAAMGIPKAAGLML